MKISLNWLRDFVDIPAGTDPVKLGELFTLRTAEVEHVENQADMFDKMVIGRIEKISAHPDADKLKVTITDVGKEKLQIVCGGPNIKEGMLVLVALVGAKVKWHGQGDPVVLEKAKIRGVESFGMICAGEEIGLDPTPEGIADLSHLKAATGTPLAAALNKNDVIFDIDNKAITHRPDLWGHYGIAREIAAITGKKLKPLKPKVSFPATAGAKSAAATALSVEVKDKKLCPRYIGVLMENIKIEPSPDWIQKRLLATGHRPINCVVDATNYVMTELGQPLHAFDADKIEGGIIVRTAKDKEEIHTLDDQKRKLTKEMLVIADHKKSVAIAGVMGGANSEVEQKTTRIILEAANFNPSSVRKTATALGLRTEAVQRFEKSLDPNLAETAMDRLCEIILQICPSAKIATPKIDVADFDEKSQKITLNLDRVRGKIGTDIPTKEIVRILVSLEFKAKESTDKKIEVQIPTFRQAKDVSIEDDLTEEIARLYGYENIKPTLPLLPAKVPLENNERKLKHLAREILSKGLGFHEVYNYSFYSLKDIQKCLLPEELHIKVENPLSLDQTHMRLSLIPNMLKNTALNQKNFSQFSIYEIGRTYEDLQEYFPIEEKKICAMIVRGKNTGGNEEDVFSRAKGALENLLSFFATQGLSMRRGESLAPYAHPGKYASYHLKKDDTFIARVFELHPMVAKNYELEDAKIAAFEINFTALATLGRRERKYSPIPKFPGIEFDVSVLINKTVTIEQMLREIESADKKLVHSVHLFDLYEGKNVPEDKKSCAFKIMLQASDRTLESDEMKCVQQEVFTRLQKLGGEIRGLRA
ncbi:phenylalanine--tRNA ligase subunit beta [Patescibacteria group bacterium]|nr:phenylalanine--tRNA ligase subunit beta [Patescibacteria group bacterium]MBU1703041.1 phenylalanine--tRNA ligase subunit beta [Patescibacteria group bacterium]MBU1954184.1 phenylalanine--tRNA ligase subunit beta [Patescibacteria group bacterium]